MFVEAYYQRANQATRQADRVALRRPHSQLPQSSCTQRAVNAITHANPHGRLRAWARVGMPGLLASPRSWRMTGNETCHQPP